MLYRKVYIWAKSSAGKGTGAGVKVAATGVHCEAVTAANTRRSAGKAL